MNEATRGRSVVMQPGDGPSWWQPVPANGHADPVLFPANTGFDALSTGFQTIAVGGRVREHSHGEQVEIQICFRGKGHVNVDGVRHDIVPGSATFLGCDVKHEIVNDGDEDLVMLWIISPPGLEDFFAAVGRPRDRGRPGAGALRPSRERRGGRTVARNERYGRRIGRDHAENRHRRR